MFTIHCGDQAVKKELKQLLESHAALKIIAEECDGTHYDAQKMRLAIETAKAALGGQNE